MTPFFQLSPTTWRITLTTVIAVLVMVLALKGISNKLLSFNEAHAASSTDDVLIGAGDIADCRTSEDEETSKLLDQNPGTVFTLGDSVYFRGTEKEFSECYEPTWGRHKDRTKPVAGNHDYMTDDGLPYYEYFGRDAGSRKKGYYSYKRGAWQIIVLNSNCDEVGGCEKGSPQYDWLIKELKESNRTCTIAMWHHARYSSGHHGKSEFMQDIWSALYAYETELVLQGHDHHYERFAPMNADGYVDHEKGLHSFVVGTGGTKLRPVEATIRNSRALNDHAHGVLKLTLGDDSLDYEFLPIEGRRFKDEGTIECH